jgi:hypothetical protein
MGSVFSFHNFDLSQQVLPTLTPFTLLSNSKYRELSELLFSHTSHDSKLSPTSGHNVLKYYFPNPKPLIDAFTITSPSQAESYVDIKYLLVALCFYSHSTTEIKARNLFKLFLSPNSHTLKLPDLTKLIKSLIVSVYLMTGQDIPEDSSCYRVVAQEVMGLMDMLNIKRVNIEEFVNSIKRDEGLLRMISKSRLYISVNDYSLPTIRRNKTVIITQPNRTDCSARLPSAERYRNIMPASVHSVKFPNLVSSAVYNTYTPNERVIYQAYANMKLFRSKVAEKDLAYYLCNQCLQKPLYMSRNDWSDYEISLEEAIETFKPYYDYLNDFASHTSDKNETLTKEELEAYANVFEKGDVDHKGWDKSDVFDVIGKHSTQNAYYLIAKHRINRKNRLQFHEFLRSCLPENKKFDERSVNLYYVSKQRNSF